MNIDELTLGQMKEIAGLLGCTKQASTVELSTVDQHAFEVGKAYLIRSVTHHYLGQVAEIKGLCVVMKACVWVADDGRFHKLLQGEWDNASEREPFGKKRPVQVFFGGMLDATEWEHDIPEDVK